MPTIDFEDARIRIRTSGARKGWRRTTITYPSWDGWPERVQGLLADLLRPDDNASSDPDTTKGSDKGGDR